LLESMGSILMAAIGIPTPTSNTAIAGEIGAYVTPTQIVFTVGSGAPTPSTGVVILEWLSFLKKYYYLKKEGFNEPLQHTSNLHC